MTEVHQHASHPGLIKRLKRADGHLRHVIEMIEEGKPCGDIAIQLQAVEKALTAAKRTLIHDHIDHCLGHGGEQDLAEMRALAKLL
ncbi:metal-sensing transcriptional repressor [Roseibium aggregatum]|uniref:Metal-sensing transcriptional repressor n=1 Tax=Roseibium aggregatum TaxID=187304 RepID=A0A926NU17_9HYPH|nr:metal-sensing transcriptional repressor [Roseibium aggregatum]MBD1547377.1 metal-sensing transcriptional repressor [Roseibium aggregatum]